MKKDIVKIVICFVCAVSSACYIIAAYNWLPFDTRVTAQFVPDILCPIIITVCAALLLFACRGMTTKKCLLITAALDLLIGAEYSYDFLIGLETGIYGIEDPAAIISLVCGIHVLFAAAVWAVSFLIWRAMEKHGMGIGFTVGMKVKVH